MPIIDPTVKPTVFIGSSTAALPIAREVSEHLKPIATVTGWEIAFAPGKFLLDGLIEQSHKSDFGVFVVRADDTATIQFTEYWSVRDNVLFEAGVFMGAIGRERSFLLWPRMDSEKKMRLPSDLAGLIRAEYTPAKSGSTIPSLGSDLEPVLARIKELGCAHRIRYDEITALRTTLRNRVITVRAHPNRSLEKVVQIAAKRWSHRWTNATEVTALTDAIKADNNKETADDVFWWLLIYGVITFNNRDIWNDGPSSTDWYYKDSLEYTQITERGVELLNELQAAPDVAD